LIDLLRSLHEKEPTKGYDRDSLEIFERKQGRLFLEEIGRSGARNFAGLPEEVKSRETELDKRLANLQTVLGKERSKPQPDRPRLQTLESEFEQARTALKGFQAELRAKHPDYYALKYPQPASLADLQTKVLKPGEILLVYAVMQDKTCLWVIGKGVFRLQTVPVGEQDLARKVAAYRRLVLKTGDEEGAAKPQKDTKEAREKLRPELYNLLIPTQVRGALAPGSRLYIVPTGPLYSLPFEALEMQAAGQAPHYLVEDQAVAYLSSASLLKTLREARARKQPQPPYPLLAFANPSYDKDPKGQAEEGSVRGLQTRAYKAILRGGFIDLPETEDEARAIKAVLQAPEASNPLQVKEAASRSTVFSLNQAGKLAAYRYLVFACHGVLPGEVDVVVQPALVLSHPEKEGYLTMGDVFGLQLNADLVSLSACNTGRGSEVKGEGVMGLTRAFMYSGSPAVSVTLWSIESQSAKELDVGMFRYLAQKQGRAEALRQIKLDMLRGEKGEQYRHPFFWAPLVVFGDAQ
jgi:CHAT domain-containing protein